MAALQAEQAWAVSYTPDRLIEMAEGYDLEALKMLNEHLAKGNSVVLSDDTQGYQGETWSLTSRPPPRSPTGP
jgi:hypothetical protein